MVRDNYYASGDVERGCSDGLSFEVGPELTADGVESNVMRCWVNVGASSGGGLAIPGRAPQGATLRTTRNLSSAPGPYGQGGSLILTDAGCLQTVERVRRGARSVRG